MIGEPGLAVTMAHEFFHVLQSAHNSRIGFGYRTIPYTDDFDIIRYAEFWFVEATANWVVSYLYRDQIDPDVLFSNFSGGIVRNFFGVDVPLTYSPPPLGKDHLHVYAAFIYFLFLEQEVGAEPIAELWEKLEMVEPDDFDRTTELIGEILPFETHFRDFTVRNLNLDLTPGDPISPLYNDLDPSIPRNVAPPLNFPDDTNGRLRLRAEPYVYPETLPNLAGHYFYFTPGAGVGNATLDFSGIDRVDNLDVDILIPDANGVWTRLKPDPQQPIELCAAQGVDTLPAFYLILTNHGPSDRDIARGSFSATTASYCA
jgi:hypothetical protein